MMDIRPLMADDAAPVRQLLEHAFGQEDEANLVDKLRADGDVEYERVCLIDDKVTGHILLSRMQTPEGCLGLAPVAVKPDGQKRGIGKAMILDSLSLAKRDGWQAVFLLGDPAYYEKFGFSVTAAAKFDTPYPKDYFMVLDLTGYAVDNLHGPAEYASAFAAM